MNEAETLAELNDPLLVAAGWGVVEGSRIRREFPIAPGRIEGGGRRGKSLSADYVLSFRNTALAVVEAKADTLLLTEGVGQAKDYAAKLQLRFTYASNGKGIYAIDMDSGQEGEAEGFPTPFRVKQITTTLDEYIYTPDDTVVEGEIEAGKLYKEADFNKIIEIKQREQHRVEIFLGQIDQREKTLVFCATQDHALAIRDLINQHKISTDPHHAHHLAKTLHWRGCPQRAQHRPWHPPLRG